jgi:hypothetical protein
MTDWCTAVASKKRKPSRRSFKLAWRNSLEMHPTKTKVVYCKDENRRGKYPNVKFDFLGVAFGLGWYDVSATTSCFADLIRQ